MEAEAKRLRCKFKSVDPVFKDKFSTSSCLLTISVGQEAHEGEYFRSTVALINKSFASCTMMIDDSLQRHSMVLELDIDADAYHEKSVIEGDLWLERNKHYYEQLDNLKIIHRWDELLNHPMYEQYQAEILRELDNNLEYMKAFDESIKQFLTRYTKRISDIAVFDLVRARKLCFDYLVEECTAMRLWPEFACHFEVYPGPRNQAMSKTHELFVLPQYPDYLHAVALKFINKKQFKPQLASSQKMANGV